MVGLPTNVLGFCAHMPIALSENLCYIIYLTRIVLE